MCERQFQPGFTHWGSFAEFVAIEYADVNLVHLPDEITFVTAASLGCRFVTSFRAIVDQGKGIDQDFYSGGTVLIFLSLIARILFFKKIA